MVWAMKRDKADLCSRNAHDSECRDSRGQAVGPALSWLGDGEAAAAPPSSSILLLARPPRDVWVWEA